MTDETDPAGQGGPAPPGGVVPVGTPGSKATARVSRTDFALLVASAAIFVAGLSYLGALRCENFFCANWDLGINQQMLWTTVHGRLLYETGDAEFYNTQSFLQVHSTYVAFLVAPIYGAWPDPLTLFVLQSGVFAASIVPLYLIARRVIERRWLLGLVVLLYLASFPAISGLLYDFHWEAFLPLEFLCFFYLYRTGRRSWSLIPLAFGVLTLEVFPFLIVGVGLLALYERARLLGLHTAILRRDREVRLAIALILAMAAVYVVLRLLQYLVIPALTGYVGAAGGIASGLGSPFAFHASPTSLGLSVDYWLLLFAAAGFLPLFAPRYLILTLPWFVYSFFLTPFFSSQFGNQYALVAVATLSVAMIYGAAHLERIALDDRKPHAIAGVLAVGCGILAILAIFRSPELLSRAVPWPLQLALIGIPIALLFVLWRRSRPMAPRYARRPVRLRPLPRRWSSRRTKAAMVGGALAVFLVFNVAMSPLNPPNYMATQYPGYWVKYSPNPASGEMEWVVSHLPADAVVLSSDFLFPYVANNPNAWAVPWYPVVPGQPPLYFPFGAKDLPAYVLIDQADWYNFPPSITTALANASEYGLLAYVFTTAYPGPIALYERSYSGPYESRNVEVPPARQLFGYRNISAGPSGEVQLNETSLFGQVITSVPVAQPTVNSSVVWLGPYVSLPPGTYEMSVSLSGSLLAGGSPQSPIATLTGGLPSVTTLYNLSVFASQLSPSAWIVLNWTVHLTIAYPVLDLEGTLEYFGGRPNGEVALNYFEIQDESSPAS